MSVVDVEPRAIGQHRIGQVAFDHGCCGRQQRHVSRIIGWRFITKVPIDFCLSVSSEGVDENAGGDDRVAVGPSSDSVLSLDT